MDKVRHELIKRYISENESSGTVYLSTPVVWMDSAVKYHFWMTE